MRIQQFSIFLTVVSAAPHEGMEEGNHRLQTVGAPPKAYLLSSMDGNWLARFASAIEGTKTRAIFEFDKKPFILEYRQGEYKSVYSGRFDEASGQHEVIIRLAPSGLEYSERSALVEEKEVRDYSVAVIPMAPGSGFLEATADGFLTLGGKSEVKLIVPGSDDFVKRSIEQLCGKGAKGFDYVDAINKEWKMAIKVNGHPEERIHSFTPEKYDFAVPWDVLWDYRDTLYELGFSGSPGRFVKKPCPDYEDIVKSIPPLTLRFSNGVEVSVSPEHLIERRGDICKLAMDKQSEDPDDINYIGAHFLFSQPAIHFTKSGRIGFCRMA